MLQANHLTKIYRAKKGVSVCALNDVSLILPDTGMVVLLGKSGSGKSTLLNVLGGLDRMDEGEIVINGTSSANFKQSDFDCYRNTYVGFIFQSYNVLQEFNVASNIAIALELQGKRATDEEIHSILKTVDLEGLGDRRPNELSGGQLQRVAIARALVKNPQIIMADEPTGALDSATGKQVFDTLKRLSSDKLVLVVSHDREFAESYADRIIELSDGKIISDVSKEAGEEEPPAEEALSFHENTIEVKQGYLLTEEDRIRINEYLSSLKNEAPVQLKQVSQAVKSGRKGEFVPTDEKTLPTTTTRPYKPIRSKLSLKRAFTIGASGLKVKPVKLAFTILLSFIAFTLFGLSDTVASYNKYDAFVNSIVDTNVQYAAVRKNEMRMEDGEIFKDRSNLPMTVEDLAALSARVGTEFQAVYEWQESFSDYLWKPSDSQIYSSTLQGVYELNDATLQRFGYTVLSGRLPQKNQEITEIVVTDYVCELFRRCGYKTAESASFDENSGTFTSNIGSADDLVGKEITLDDKKMRIVGVINTGFQPERYRKMEEWLTGGMSDMNIEALMLLSEISNLRTYGPYSLVYVANGCAADVLGVTQMQAYELQYFSEGASYPGRCNYIGSVTSRYLSFVSWFQTKHDLQEDEVIVPKTVFAQIAANSSQFSEILVSAEDSETYGQGKVDTTTLQTVIGSWSFQIETTEAQVAFLKKYGVSSVNLSAAFAPKAEDGTVKDQTMQDCKTYRIVGILDDLSSSELTWTEQQMFLLADSVVSTYDVKTFERAMAPMPASRSAIRKLANEHFYVEKGSERFVRYTFANNVTDTIDTANELFEGLGKIFAWIGVGFAVFAVLMFSNFIATSISYKRKEIGILRAIGSRSKDVFAIFFSESFIIAMINYVLASVATIVLTVVINNAVRNGMQLLVTLLSFGLRQVVVLFLLCVGIAAVASFLPVQRIASKKPIDAIRNK